MNSRIVSSLLIALAFTLALGCSEDRANRLATEPVSDSQTWGVLIYAAGNYDGDVIQNSQMSLTSRAIATVRVMETELNAPQTLTQACIAAPVTQGDVEIYEVDFSPRTPEGLLNSELVANLGQVSTGDPLTLRAFLETALSQMNADHYVLCLAGDGHGWQGMMGDYGNSLGMPVDMLRRELESVSHLLPNGGFDILALYARNMGTLENVYELRECADYIVTSTFNVEQPHHEIIAEWYRDLQAQPELSPRELAAYMIDAERLAQDTETAVFLTSLWDASAVGSIASAFDEFSRQWLAASELQSPTLLGIRDELMQTDLHNGIQLDIQEYADALAASGQFTDEQYAPFLDAAVNLVHAAEAARLMSYGSDDAAGHAGLCYYFPTQTDLDSTAGDAYAELQLSNVSGAWANYVKQLPRAPRMTVTISGLGHVRAGLSVQNLVFFMDTLATGLPAPTRNLSPQWTPVTANGDTVDYSISFSLTEADSMMVRFGLYIDNNQDGQLNTGDRFGFWDLPGGGNFERLMLHRGDVLTGRNVFINFNRN